MSAKKPIYMENTEIPIEKTAAEVTSCLVQAGAKTIHTRYESGKISGLDWTMQLGANEIRFSMPARVDPVYQLLCSRRSGWSATYRDQYFGNDLRAKMRAQAERVAWRQLLRWVQAQLAMVEVGMVKPAEVFMPYMQHPDGTTFFDYFESKQLALPEPERAR